MKKNLTFEIVTPEGKAYADTVEYAIIPGVEGQLQILPGHVPILVAIKPGEIIVSRSGHREELAVDQGFARVLGDHLSIITEAAINVDEIDLSAVQNAEERARKALEEARHHVHFDPAEIEKLEAVARFSLVQRLAKQKKL